MLKIKTYTLMLIISLVGLNLSSCMQKRAEEQKQTEQKQLPNQLLLKDWQPKSIYKIPETHIKKAKYAVIDMHAHDYDTLRNNGLEKRIHIMDEAGVQKTVVFTEATGTKFDSLYARYSKYPDRFMVFCGIDYTGYKQKGWSQKAVKKLKRDVKEGAQGVGEMMDKHYLVPGLQSDDPRMDPIFDEIGKLGIPINIHVADPMWMFEPMDSTNDGLIRSWTWRVKNVNNKISHEGMIKTLAHTIKKHPNTTFVIAHLGNLTYDLSKLGKLFDTYPNFYADIGARFAELATIPRYAAKFLEKYQDRIVYGTDYGFETFNNHTVNGNNTSTLTMFQTTFRILETKDDHFYLTDLMGYKWPLYGLGLSDETLKKIYRDNALKIIGKKD